MTSLNSERFRESLSQTLPKTMSKSETISYGKLCYVGRSLVNFNAFIIPIFHETVYSQFSIFCKSVDINHICAHFV